MTESKDQLFERMLATKTMWDIKDTNGSWRNLNIDPLDKAAKMRIINYVAKNPGLSCGPNPGPGSNYKQIS